MAKENVNIPRLSDHWSTSSVSLLHSTCNWYISLLNFCFNSYGNHVLLFIYIYIYLYAYIIIEVNVNIAYFITTHTWGDEDSNGLTRDCNSFFIASSRPFSALNSLASLSFLASCSATNSLWCSATKNSNDNFNRCRQEATSQTQIWLQWQFSNSISFRKTLLRAMTLHRSSFINFTILQSLWAYQLGHAITTRHSWIKHESSFYFGTQPNLYIRMIRLTILQWCSKSASNSKIVQVYPQKSLQIIRTSSAERCLIQQHPGNASIPRTLSQAEKPDQVVHVA